MTQFPVSRLEGTQNKGPIIVVVFAVTLAIAFILLAARLYVRARILKRLWLDDLFIILGAIHTIVTFALIIVAVDAGLGRHLASLKNEQVSRVIEFEIVAQFVIILSTMFTRLSICLLLLRFAAQQGWFSITIYCTMGVIVITNLSSAILALIGCRPIQKFWTPTLSGSCWSQETQLSMGLYNGVTASLCDFTLAILPTFYLRNLQISPQVKIGICCLMGVGVIPGVCAISRTVLHYQFFSPDFTYDEVEGMIWAVLENNIAIIAACMTTLKPLAKLLTSSIHSFRIRPSRKDGYFNQIEDAHHLTRLQKSYQEPRDGRKVPQSPMIGNRAEVQGPARYASKTKSDRSSFSEQNVKGIKTKKAFHVTDEEYDPRVQLSDDSGSLVRGPGLFD